MVTSPRSALGRTAPAVKIPIDCHDLSLTAISMDSEGRHDVSHPEIIYRRFNDGNRRTIHKVLAGLAKRTTARSQQADRLKASDRVYDFSQIALYSGGVASAPLAMNCPSHPATLVGFPFGWNPYACLANLVLGHWKQLKS
ncbi:hypothetical protein [Bradyrhizobium sp. CW1]|uniref:hypothetical protein n=1 Tax=Bradyrhizobium sp. CW1 TaxID=2782686 RepID=UPI001FFED86F|nr:hypothetical protein [Bradyrhizobium sp. CW1]